MKTILQIKEAKKIVVLLGFLSLVMIILTCKNGVITSKLSLPLASSLQHRFLRFEPKPTVEEILKQRREILKSTCERFQVNTSLPETLPKFKQMLKKRKWLVSDAHKLIYCVIPKCSCTNMKRFLVFANGLLTSDEEEEMERPAFHNFTNNQMNLRNVNDINEIYSKLDTYRKLVVVREPMGRLLSAYRHKLDAESQNTIYENKSRMIHAFFNHVLPNDTTTATFDEFLRYTMTSEKQDVHWRLFNDLCLPCAIKYDYIAHVETIAEDMEYIAKAVKIENVTFPVGSTKTDGNILKKYYSQVDKTLVEDVYKTYKIDFELFGYDKPDL